MRYSIGQVAKKLGLTAHTLRYYNKEGLLPYVKKGSSGARVFDDEDIDWLIIVECLKGTGMKLKDIKKYINLCQEGDSTVGMRLELFRQQKKQLEEKLKQLQGYMEKIDFKIAYYAEAVANGGVDECKKNKCLMAEKERLFGHK